MKREKSRMVLIIHPASSCRYLVDDFVIQYCQKLSKKDFVMKLDHMSRKRKGKREFLNDKDTTN